MLKFDDLWIFQPLEPRIYGIYYTRIPQKILEDIWEHPLKILFLHIWTSRKCQIWKRRAPKNDEDPSKNFLKILDMGPIST